MRTLTGLTRWVALAGIAVALWAAGGPARAADSVTLQLRWEPQFQFAGYIVAKEKGYYADRDLEVDLRFAIQPDSGFLSAIDEVTESRATFGIGSVDVVYARAGGKPLSIVASVFQHSPIRIYTQGDVPVTKLSDLVKLRFSKGFQRNGPAEIELRALLSREGVDTTSAAFRAVGDTSFDGFLNGEVDVYPGFSIATPWIARQKGIELQALSPQDFGINFYGDSIFAREDYVRENPDVVGRFVDASLAGWRYALEHPEEAIRLIAERYPRQRPISDVSGFNRFQAGEVASLVDFPSVELGNTSPDRWEAMVDRLEDLGLIEDRSRMEGLVLDPLRLELDAARDFERAVMVAVAVAVALALLGTGFAVVLRWQVRRQTLELVAANRRSEEARLAAEAAGVAKAEFLATMSHELRSPLTSVIGFAELLGGRLTGDLPRDQVVSYANNIERSARSLLYLINDILDFAKLDANKVELANEPFVLAQELADLPSQFEIRAAENQVALSSSFDGLQRAVRGDAMRIRQVISNLVDNAVKFSQGGKVCLCATASPAGNGRDLLTVTVRDSGIGIEAERVERIFDPFRQADSTTSRTFGGTGLGLSISRAIARQMGGDVVVQSTPGEGSIFTATFMLESAGEYRVALSSPVRAPTGTARNFDLRVLIVDDLEANLDVADALLRGLGCDVLRAHNGAEAVQQALTGSPDLILMDLHMPVLDGVSAARKIRAVQPPGTAVKIFAWTADVTAEPGATSADVNWSGTVLKPTTMETLTQTLERATLPFAA